MGFLFSKNKKQQKQRKQKQTDIPISNNLIMVIELFKAHYSYPDNIDFVVRNIYIPAMQQYGVLFYLQSMVNTVEIEKNVITPLLENDRITQSNDPTKIIESVVTINSISTTKKVTDAIDYINDGSTMLIIDGIAIAYAIPTIGFAHRSVDRALDENVVKGPKESFIESSQINRSLIRKQLRYENLVAENISVGKRGKNQVTMMYIKDFADPDLIISVKDRIKKIDTDNVQNLEILEQYIEERSFSIVPSILFTERPDRAVSFLEDGHVVLLMDNSAAAAIVPVTIWAFFQTPEDTYLRWFYGNFARLIRIMAIFITAFTPAFYIAITNYHTEMLPSDLLLAIASTREMIPFPAIMELLLMEFSFEILREAGIRIPNPIGPTIGIVGALILGQAAVDANIVSPIMVIVVSLTGLASFAIPNISFNYMMRIIRFLFTFAAALFGIFGIMAALMIFLTYLSSLKTFQVPFLSPVAPYYNSANDTYFRFPVWMDTLRPTYLKQKDKTKKKINRKDR